MPSFPSGAIERLPWKELRPQVVCGDTRTASHFAMSPLSRSLQRLRIQWNACEEWEKMDLRAEEERASVRYARRISTPPAKGRSSLPVDHGSSTPTNFRAPFVSAWDEVLREEKYSASSSKSTSDAVNSHIHHAIPAQISVKSAGCYEMETRKEESTETHPIALRSDNYTHRAIYAEYLKKRIQTL